jgi:hypothetical protein
MFVDAGTFTLPKEQTVLVVLIAPQSRSRRLDRNPTVGRENLLWILRGHPAAVPLFSMARGEVH